MYGKTSCYSLLILPFDILCHMTIADDEQNPNPQKKLAQSLGVLTALRSSMQKRLVETNKADANSPPVAPAPDLKPASEITPAPKPAGEPEKKPAPKAPPSESGLPK